MAVVFDFAIEFHAKRLCVYPVNAEFGVDIKRYKFSIFWHIAKFFTHTVKMRVVILAMTGETSLSTFPLQKAF